MKWIALSDRPECEKRMSLLSERLNESGLINKFSFDVTTAAELESRLRKAMAEFDQIRIEGSLKAEVLKFFDQLPLSERQVGSADAIVKIDGVWWPRHFESEAIHHSLVVKADSANLNGNAFLIGSGVELLPAVAALVRFGFLRFAIADPVEERGLELVESLKKTFFKIDFRYVRRHMMTQLPSVNGVGINNLSLAEGPDALEELVYFNFLAPGGVWIDLPLYPPNRVIMGEAAAIGAKVETGAQIAAYVDELWATRVSPGPLRFDRDAHAAAIDLITE